MDTKGATRIGSSKRPTTMLKEGAVISTITQDSSVGRRGKKRRRGYTMAISH